MKKNIVVFILVSIFSISCSSTQEDNNRYPQQEYVVESADTKYICSVTYWMRQDTNNDMPEIIGFSYLRINTNITQVGLLCEKKSDYPNSGKQFDFNVNNTEVILTLKDNSIIKYNFYKVKNDKVNLKYLKLNNTIYLGIGSESYSEHDF